MRLKSAKTLVKIKTYVMGIKEKKSKMESLISSFKQKAKIIRKAKEKSKIFDE